MDTCPAHTLEMHLLRAHEVARDLDCKTCRLAIEIALMAAEQIKAATALRSTFNEGQV